MDGFKRFAKKAGNGYCEVMTFAECLLMVCLFAGVYYLLRPLQRVVETMILRFLGHNPKWVDAVIIKRDKE